MKRYPQRTRCSFFLIRALSLPPFALSSAHNFFLFLLLAQKAPAAKKRERNKEKLRAERANKCKESSRPRWIMKEISKNARRKLFLPFFFSGIHPSRGLNTYSPPTIFSSFFLSLARASLAAGAFLRVALKRKGKKNEKSVGREERREGSRASFNLFPLLPFSISF